MPSLPQARHAWALIVGCAAVGGAGCNSPVAPAAPLALVCPTPISVSSTDGSAVPISFTPVVEGGRPSVTTSCLPASGSPFGPGVTAVSCEATDADLRASQCSFAVTVLAQPRLEVTRFLAFGDSITEGKQASGDLGVPYPVLLERLLRERYTLQASQFSLVNAGCGGETITPHPEPCRGGVLRLADVLGTVQPDAVLIQEGVNDLSQGQTVAAVVNGLREMIREATRRRVRVLLATLTPLRGDGTPPRGNRALQALSEANAQIAALARDEQVDLVDLYAGFGGPDPYIDVDGLHPTQAGYQKMAEIFFDTIQHVFEIAGPGPAFR